MDPKADQETFPQYLARTSAQYSQHVPSHTVVYRFVDSLTDLLFPVRSDQPLSLAQIEERWEGLHRDFAAIICPLCAPEVACEILSEQFFARIAELHASLVEDAEMYRDSDPASGCVEEVILCYPGFYAVMVHRIAHEIHRLGIPLLPRVIAEYAHSRTGIDIHPGATIGKYFFIDHGTGIVIGETTIIGCHVKLYQGVTLGALSTKGGQKLRDVRRHPTIGDNVTIYSGASILGGETVIEEGVVIGGNSFITQSIKKGTKVSVRNQELIYHSDDESLHHKEQDESWFYII